MMTVPQLRAFIDELVASGFNHVPWAVELQRKIAFPFVTVVMTLLAVPFGVSTGRRGTLYGIGLGIVLALSLLDLSAARSWRSAGAACCRPSSRAGRRTS